MDTYETKPTFPTPSHHPSIDAMFDTVIDDRGNPTPQPGLPGMISYGATAEGAVYDRHGGKMYLSSDLGGVAEDFDNNGEKPPAVPLNVMAGWHDPAYRA